MCVAGLKWMEKCLTICDRVMSRWVLDNVYPAESAFEEKTWD